MHESEQGLRAEIATVDIVVARAHLTYLSFCSLFVEAPVCTSQEPPLLLWYGCTPFPWVKLLLTVISRQILWWYHVLTKLEHCLF